MIDRRTIPEVDAFYLDRACERSEQRRNRNRAAGYCICGPFAPPGTDGNIHGPVVSGGKCQRCLDVHKRTA